MISNKKGLSMIVSTLIIILLVLVAVGVIWVVVNNLIQEGSDTIEISSKCLEVDIQATGVTCGAADCDVTLSRAAGGDTIAGVKLAFTNASGTSNFVVDIAGDISPLAITTSTATAVNATLPFPTNVEVTAYFQDTSGNEQLCSQSTEFSFTTV